MANLFTANTLIVNNHTAYPPMLSRLNVITAKALTERCSRSRLYNRVKDAAVKTERKTTTEPSLSPKAAAVKTELKIIMEPSPSPKAAAVKTE